MSVDSFAKIDMSLDDIIKLNKKEKAAAAKKSAGKKLTPAQRNKAQALKIKARYSKQTTGQKAGKKTPTFKSNAAKRGALARKNRGGATRGGNINRNLNKTQRPNTANNKLNTSFQRKPVTQRGRGALRGRLGTRINNAQQNQRTKRQQLMNKNRRGLSTSQGNRGNSRQASNTRFQRNNNKALRGRNRQYNQQPRSRQQGGRVNFNKGRQNQTQQRSARYFGNTGVRRGGRGRGQGRAASKAARSVTMG